MHVAVLLGQSNSGDDDGPDCIGCWVFETVEQAKQVAQTRRNENFFNTLDEAEFLAREEHPDHRYHRLIQWQDSSDSAYATTDDELIEVRCLRVEVAGFV